MPPAHLDLGQGLAIAETNKVRKYEEISKGKKRGQGGAGLVTYRTPNRKGSMLYLFCLRCGLQEISTPISPHYRESKLRLREGSLRECGLPKVTDLISGRDQIPSLAPGHRESAFPCVLCTRKPNGERFHKSGMPKGPRTRGQPYTVP